MALGLCPPFREMGEASWVTSALAGPRVMARGEVPSGPGPGASPASLSPALLSPVLRISFHTGFRDEKALAKTSLRSLPLTL